MISRDFYNIGSGDKFVEQLTRSTQADAQSVSGFFYELAYIYNVKRAKPLLEEMLVEQAAKIEDINIRVAELDKRIEKSPRDIKLSGERDTLLSQYTRESSALKHIEQALRGLATVREPTAPAWLIEWMRATILHG